MKKYIIMFLLIGIALTGCSSKNENQENSIQEFQNSMQEPQNIEITDIPSVKTHPEFQENLEKLYLNEWRIKKLYYFASNPVFTVDEIDASDSNGNECVFLIKNENTLFFVGGRVLLELELI